MKKEISLDDPDSLFLPDEIEEFLINGLNKSVVDKIFSYGRYLKVSDIVFQVGFPIAIKVNNLVFPISKSEISSTTIQQIVSVIFQSAEGDDLNYMEVMNGNLPDTSYTFKISKPGEAPRFIRYRINLTRDGEHGLYISCRLNNEIIPTLAQIGHSVDGEIYKNMFRMKGTVLITGAVDSGKTTLVYSLLNEFITNDKRPAVIGTYENPIEGDLQSPAKYKSKYNNKIVSQCPVPIGAKTFAEAIQRSLRRNLDIILLGEVRTDVEANAFIEGAMATAKLMIATLHTDSVYLTVDRLVNLLVANNPSQAKAMVSAYIQTANMIVSQKLLSTIDKKRVAVYECFIFDREIKEELKALPINELADTIKDKMKGSGLTMADKARVLLNENIISEEIFNDFERDFGY
jgi:Tfp pilus assembly pilus retraction ATPase PilT